MIVKAAKAEFEKELQITPSHVAATAADCHHDLRTDTPRAAVPLAREAIRLQPENALGHAVLGRAYMQHDELGKALPELQASARIAPLNPQIHLYLQQVYGRLGNTAEAEKEKAEFLRLKSQQDSSKHASDIGDRASSKP